MEDPRKLHVALLPWLAFGHMIPFFEVAKKIAQKGHKVSYICTPRNIKRLPKIPQDLEPHLKMVEITLPKVEGLPEDAEATSDIPIHLILKFMKALSGLQKPITHFLQTQTQTPDWIIHDFTYPWLPPIASKLGVSTAYFLTSKASSCTLFEGILALNRKEANDDSYKRPEQYTVPPKWVPFPNNLVLRKHEAKKLLSMGKGNSNDDSSFLKPSGKGSDVIIIRSCKELEEQWLNLLSKFHGKPVIPIGLLPNQVQLAEEGNDEDGNWKQILEWLDKQEKGSVVYVALGSEITPSQEDFNELALGLELSGLPFFWVLRKNQSSDDDTLEIKLPNGFEERTKGHGVICTSWVPQKKILAHDSVGGFLTHCGWSSIIEGLQFGRPLIMLPFLYDQGLNARELDKKVGIEVPRDEEDGWFTKNWVAESVRLVVVEEEGKIYRDEAKKMSYIFGDQALHDNYINECLEFFKTKHTDAIVNQPSSGAVDLSK